MIPCDRLVEPVKVLWCCAAILTATAAAGRAQVGATTDIITGAVIDEFGNPLINVVIEATSLETEITRSTTTDDRGRYTILFPDGGGQYRVTARVIGMQPAEVIITRFADEDRLVWDVKGARCIRGSDD